MLPTMFIGSSSEARHFADAAHLNLQRDLECTVWANGVFALSEDQRASFRRQLDTSDFAAFFFAADDVTQLRHDTVNTARDNVIYEAGLFAGRLGFERCFIAIPTNVPLHIPTDLAGMTVGRYESNRVDNLEAAVNTFCAQIRSRVQVGPRARPLPQRVLELIVKYECCDWIDPIEPNRVAKKNAIAEEITAYCRSNELDKYGLLSHHRLGSYAALALAVSAVPRPADLQFLLAVKST